MKLLLPAVLSILVCSTAFAKPDVDSSAEGSLKLRLPSTNTQSSTSLLPAVEPLRFGDFTVSAGLKSFNTSGRVDEFNDTTGRRYRLKNEYYLGAVHASGWGLSLMAVTNGVSYGRSDRNAYSPGDPSLTISHPNFYKDASLQISGQLRRYLALTDRSKDRNQAQYSYYLTTSVSFAKAWAFYNVFIPRYFAQSYYKPSDTNYFIEDYAGLSKQISSWFKFGVGQHSQIEWHALTATGTSVEVYPFLTFIFSRNFSLEPRFVLPLQVANEVYDAPKFVALAQAQLEVNAQVSF